MKRLITLLIGYFLAQSAFSQTNVLDSLKQQLEAENTDTGKVTLSIRISYELQFSDTDLSAKFAENAYNEAVRLGFSKGRANALVQLANIAQLQGDYDLSEKNNRQALEIFEKSNDWQGVAIVYNNLGILAHNQSKYDEALSLYRRSLEINRRTGRLSGVATSLFCIGTVHENLSGNDSALIYYLEGQQVSESINDARLIAYAKTSMANIYFRMGDYLRSMDYNLAALKLFNERGNDYGVLKVYFSLGQTAVLIDSLDKAVWFYNKALETGTSLGSINDIAMVYHSLGQLYETMNKADSALVNYVKARELYLQTGNRENSAHILIAQARLLNGRKEHEEAVSYLDEALLIAKETEAPSLLTEVYNEMASTWAAMGNFENSYRYVRLYSNLKDSVLTVEKQKQILELQTQYETEKKEKENELLRKDQKILQTTRNSLIIGAAMLLTIVAIILRNLSVKKRDNRQLREQRDEIGRQKEIVESQKTAIEDSIRYAKRIQSAMLPPDDQIAEILPEAFILYLPRDIVSGDYYWMKEISPSKILVCAADCTGHGVPGALMSMLGMSLLADVINSNLGPIRKGEYTPASILNELRNRIKNSLRQTGKEGESRDGMDMVLAIIDRDSGALTCSGANNPLYYVNEGTLTEVKAVRNPIGIHPNEMSFSDYEATIPGGSMVYLFSDGYYDQIGHGGKKFLSKNFKKLLEEISYMPPAEIKERLYSEHITWKDGEEQVDDILVIGVRI
ncbi:MAG: tetratricopeptide repeat protein [Bacteroidales bacterium]|nr:tetratricopeptide repeat protein [Bacteroidales bacterium]